jgi:hypothetical protein
MPKIVRGRAGRQQRREETLERYGAELAPILLKQVRIPEGARVMHLGSPGAAQVSEAIAHMLVSGELVVVVYTYDEMEELRAALAGLGNVQVINEIDDLDPDEPLYDVITCVVPFHQGQGYVEELLDSAFKLMNRDGTLYLAGDRQQGFERVVEWLGSVGSRVTPQVQIGQMRVVTATKPGPGGGLRRASPTS